MAILRVRDRGYLLLRWYTPTFEGSSNQIPATHVCRQRYDRVKLTNKVVVEELDHIERTVAVAPNWAIAGLWYINKTPLGTTIQSKAWETAMALQEVDENLAEEVAVRSPYVRLAESIQEQFVPP